MFQVTRFVMEDFVDSLDQIIYIVSLNKRYMVYNASRRRHVHPSVMHMPAGSAPLDLGWHQRRWALQRIGRCAVITPL
jgi:hypothetical protein